MKFALLSLLTLFKVLIIGGLILFLIGFKNTAKRTQLAEEMHRRTYESIYNSENYQELPEDSKGGLEDLKVKFYFINKVNNTYSVLFAIFTFVAIIVLSISIFVDFRWGLSSRQSQ